MSAWSGHETTSQGFLYKKDDQLGSAVELEKPLVHKKARCPQATPRPEPFLVGTPGMWLQHREHPRLCWSFCRRHGFLGHFHQTISFCPSLKVKHSCHSLMTLSDCLVSSLFHPLTGAFPKNLCTVNLPILLSAPWRIRPGSAVKTLKSSTAWVYSNV